jgi:hypothetical protein
VFRTELVETAEVNILCPIYYSVIVVGFEAIKEEVNRIVKL